VIVATISGVGTTLAPSWAVDHVGSDPGSILQATVGYERRKPRRVNASGVGAVLVGGWTLRSTPDSGRVRFPRPRRISRMASQPRDLVRSVLVVMVISAGPMSMDVIHGEECDDRT
jgi:hypothetical protein